MHLIRTPIFKNIAGSVIFKLLTSVVSFIVVPLILSVLGKSDYAVWATITSLLAWVSLFDFGVGYSLKNKVSEYLALNDRENLNKTIAATLQFLSLSSIVLLVCFFGAFLFIDIFKEHSTLMIILYLPFILSFPSISGGFILQGQAKFNLINLINLIQPFLWLIFVFCCYKGFLKANLYVFSIAYSLILLFLKLLTIFIALKKVRFPLSVLRNYKLILELRSVVVSGIKFFVLQICNLVLFSIGNLLAYTHLDLSQVAQYDVVNKVFLMGMTVVNMVVAVFWTEISKAKALADTKKLKKIHRSMFLFSLLFSIACLCMIYVCPYFIPFWTKGVITISMVQVLPFVLLVSVQTFGYAGAVFLNAFERLKSQIILAVLSATLMIPVAKFFFGMDLGIDTMPLSSAVLTFPAVIYYYIESKKCIERISL